MVETPTSNTVIDLGRHGDLPEAGREEVSVRLCRCADDVTVCSALIKGSFTTSPLGGVLSDGHTYVSHKQACLFSISASWPWQCL